MTYRRFPTSAEAIKYAVETLKPDSRGSAALVVGTTASIFANSTLASSIRLAGSPFSRAAENDGHLTELERSTKTR